MEFIKSVIGKLEIHLNVEEKTLLLRYCGSEIHLYIGNDNKPHLDMKLLLEGPDQPSIEAPQD